MLDQMLATLNFKTSFILLYSSQLTLLNLNNTKSLRAAAGFVAIFSIGVTRVSRASAFNCQGRECSD